MRDWGIVEVVFNVNAWVLANSRHDMMALVMMVIMNEMERVDFIFGYWRLYSFW